MGAFDQEGNITYHMTGMTYNVTTYSVWAQSQQSSGSLQRVGYIVVSVPVKAIVVRGSTDLTGSSCETFALSTYGVGWKGNSTSLLQTRIGPIGALPDAGFAPVFTYGAVKVMSGSSVAAAALVRPHSNVTFALPPGRYTAVATVSILGVPFSVNCGTYSSAAGASVSRFTVTLAGVGGVWYAFELAVGALLAVVIVLIFWRFRLWPVVARGYKRVARTINEWIAERMRAYSGVREVPPLGAVAAGRVRARGAAQRL
ncbi:MAG: hypothetical protein JRN48_00125 [Nitrososphaerota archaeon]|nr:hypothetical protein [Nitrososphaerota archaeon]